MVLEEVAGDFPAEFSSTSDQLPAPDRQPDGRIALGIKRSELPHMVTIFGQQTLPSDLDKYIGLAADHAMKVLGRPPRQDEIDALAYHFCSGLRTASFGAPMGAFVASLVCYQRRETFRFPGWTPGPRFDPNKFATLRGTQARLVWHVLRSSAYIVTGVLLGSTFFASYGASLNAVHRQRDARLKEYNDAERRYRMKNQKLREVDQTPGPRESETYEMARQRQNVQEALRRKKVAGHTDASVPPTDDMSPTGGSFKEDFENTGASDLLSDSQLQRQERQENRMREREAATHNATGSSTLSDTDSTPRAALATQPQQQKTSSSTSSWDRLRERAGVKPSSPASTVTQADDGLSFMQYSSASAPLSSQSSQSASASKGRSDAQREFDEQLERERNLSSGKDDGDKWA